MQSTRISVTIRPIGPQYCYYFVITLMLISLAVAQHNSIGFDTEDSLPKRASAGHSHNIMRFGRGGHNIMHFGKRAEQATIRLSDNTNGNDGNDISNEQDTSSYSNGEEQSNPSLYDPTPFQVVARSPKTRYFIPHAFIASLYTHPRPFLKKAAESRDNVFMHFG